MRGRSWVWVVMLAAAAVLAGAGPARADFNVTFCDGTPAAPWTSAFAGTFDECATGAGLEFLNPSVTQTADTSVGATLNVTGGEEITHVAATFSTADTTSGGADFYFGYGGDVSLLVGPMGNDHIGTAVDAPVQDSTDVWLSVFCVPGANCTFSTQNIVTLKTMTVTIHDTLLPAVQATGGDLLDGHVPAGTKTLDYAAGDGGSGVANVTLSLGSEVVGSQPQTCQPGVLRPCQPSVAGAFVVDTKGLCDGTYPAVLTAYDESGDATPLTVGTVTRRGHACRQTLKGSRRGQAPGTSCSPGAGGPRRPSCGGCGCGAWVAARRSPSAVAAAAVRSPARPARVAPSPGLTVAWRDGPSPPATGSR
ncbi:MAG TPA: hypothetical protein VGL69_14290 [Solirubrobacteraceae bacterium]